jgi:hypothetical protein
MTTSSAAPLLERVGHQLTARGLTFSRHPVQPLLALRFVTDDAEWATFVEVREQPPRLAIYSSYPERAEPEARAELAELLTRINYGMYVGNFELDLDDGSVRFKTSLELADVELTAALFDRLLTVNLDEAKRYAGAISEVAAGTASAAEALEDLDPADPESP